MSITLDLPKELESKLAAEAVRLGLPLSEYAVRTLASTRPGSTQPKTKCNNVGGGDRGRKAADRDQCRAS